MSNPLENINFRLKEIKNKNLYRKLNYLESPQDKIVSINGEKQILLASNNYLALANRAELREAANLAIEKYGFGSGGSRLTTGTYEINKVLEEKIAKFLNRESSLVFNSGYAANTGVIAAIANESYTIFSDELNHASIIDGCKLAKGKTVIFKHNDMEDLKGKLKLKTTENSIIITEGVFSMDGDICNLEEIIKIAKSFDSLVMVDDAHGLGVLGDKGKGVLEHFNVKKDVHIYIGTLSKAIGSEGGFIAGEKNLIDFVKNTARPFIFSTAIAMAAINASIKAFEIIEKEESLTKNLKGNIEYFNLKLKEIGIESNSKSAIIPILIGDEEKALRVSEYLKENGIYVSAIRYPTVKIGEAILRVCLMTTHSKEDIDFFIEKLKIILD
ncbi:MAG: 8-amino-7-oxononanoate synthase [Sarcina sp.]